MTEDMVAKKNSSVRIFKLKKKLVDDHRHEELNDVVRFAEEVTLLKIPEFVKKKISK